MRQQPTSITELSILAATVFSLTIPMIEADLKKAYRRETAKWHPDRKGGDVEKMKAVTVTYQKLTSDQAISFGIFQKNGEDAVEIAKTTSGEFLMELGLGLGPLKNGVDCPQCKHKGYTAFHDSHRTNCPDCFVTPDYDFGMTSWVPLKMSCKACQGSGSLLTVDGRKISCGPCSGTGKVSHTKKRTNCPRCLGTHSIWAPRGQPRYDKCYHCKGTGEIEIFNPVIPKGRLLYRQQNI